MNEVTTGEWIQIGLVITIPILVAVWVDGRLRGERRRETMAHLWTMLQYDVEVPLSFWVQGVSDVLLGKISGEDPATRGTAEEMVAKELHRHLISTVNYLIMHGAGQEALDLKKDIRSKPTEGKEVLSKEDATELMHDAMQIGARLTKHTFEKLPDDQIKIGQRKWRQWTGF